MSLLNRDGSVKIVSCILRIGANGSVVDNLHSGGFSVGIDQNGRLMKIGYKINGEQCTEHPDTNVKFEGIQIPSFDAMKKLVSKAHRHVPKCRLMSWDCAFDTENNPIIIEGNFCSGGIDVHQLAIGPVFGEYTKEVLDEVFHK